VAVIEIFDPKGREIVGEGEQIERVATGFRFTEGPLWHDGEHYLLFSDIQDDAIWRWSAAGGVSIFRQPSRMANGNAWDLDGRLLTCEHATSRLTRTEPDGSLTVIASHYRGKELNSPNDIVIRSDGLIYFTDPDFGRREAFGIARKRELPYCGVYRVDPRTAEVQLLAHDFGQPNGLCFSPDESLLYVNDSPRRHIRVFRVRPDGALEEGCLFAETVGEEPGVPDGMKIDMLGNVYCTGPGGIHVFNPAGHLLARVRTPEVAANFTFGDADYQTLYITARTSLYRLRVQVSGRPQILNR
jgi:gluconolactonase